MSVCSTRPSSYVVVISAETALFLSVRPPVASRKRMLSLLTPLGSGCLGWVMSLSIAGDGVKWRGCSN